MISGIKRKRGDTIVFVQLSDIHLDRQFSEVRPPPRELKFYICTLYLVRLCVQELTRPEV